MTIRSSGRIRRWLYFAAFFAGGMAIGVWFADVALPKVAHQVQEQEP